MRIKVRNDGKSMEKSGDSVYACSKATLVIKHRNNHARRKKKKIEEEDRRGEREGGSGMSVLEQGKARQG